MPKMTKKQLDKTLARIKDEIQQTEDRINQLIHDKQFDDLNDLNDRIYDLKKEAESAKWDYDTRNWTSSTWQSWSLVCQNID